MKIIDPDQEALCEFCETYILECSSMSMHFQCEGHYCDKALELWQDNEWDNLRTITYPGLAGLDGRLVKCENCLYDTYAGWTSVDNDPCLTCSAEGSNHIATS